jgi:hypothetical protein
MSKTERVMAVIVGLALPASFVIGSAVGQPVGLVLAFVVLLAMWRFAPGLWSTIGVGLLSGAIAGALVLGPGFRLAMRMVAIVDIRRAEFSVGGTLFIIVGVGVIFGGMGGFMAALLRRGLGWSGLVMSGVMAVGLVGLLYLDTNLRSELVTLGAGPWLNIPMFAAVSFGYALFANKLIDRFENKKSRREAREPAEVRT